MFHPELVNPSVRSPAPNVVSPAGFEDEPSKSKKANPVKKPVANDLEQLKIKKAWEIAMGPAKSVPMNLIMSYMTGNSLQVIPIMMTLMLLWNPLKAIFTETNALFRRLATEKNAHALVLPKVVFVLFQVANMAVGLWKLNQMGLIPNKEADWLSWQVPSTYIGRLAV